MADQDWYNDHQRMVRSNAIERVIDRFRLREGRSVETPQQEGVRRDFLGVLDAIKASRRSAYPALIRLAEVCSSLTSEQFGLFAHILRGGCLASFAAAHGVTRSAASRQWSRILGKNPFLRGMLPSRARA